MSSPATATAPAPVNDDDDRPSNPLIAWLIETGWTLDSPGDVVLGLVERMLALGFPMHRIRVTLRTLHPQFIGISYTWNKSGEVEEFTPTYEVLQTDAFQKSPYVGIFEGAGAIRRRLDVPGIELDFPILEELSEDGATDYIAMPMMFSDGKINAVTFSGDRLGGFTTAELATIDAMVPVLGRLMEVHALRRTARTILETYLGPQTGERVLNGLIKRGDGEDIHAVIWFSDLRGSTALAERLPRKQFLDLLNDYFEAIAGAVLDHGGEVLRYIGDAALAIFPIGGITDHPELCPEHINACGRALAAARDAAARIDGFNAEREERGDPKIGYGIGLHLGDVMYGNIGVPSRLEFSVIGAAANQAARIEPMTKALHKQVLVSADLARVIPEKLTSLGVHVLRGVPEPQEIFTLPEGATAAAE